MSFKLLAIRPTENCGKKFLKNLEINRIYKIYNEYKFYNDKSEIDCFSKEKANYSSVLKIEKIKQIPDNFFGDKVSVSAIVGKNGSGKSTLINLLVGALNQLSLQLKGKEIKTTAELERTGKELDQKVYCEIFYEIDNNFYCLKVEDILCSFINITQKKDAEFEPFFYTNIINYSLYAFNSWELGDWIDGLFHKNDAYQIPIVINPKRGSRTDGAAGILDVNNENYLLQQRLLSIILLDTQYEITSNLVVDNLKLKTKEPRIYWAYSKNDENLILKIQESDVEEQYMDHLKGDFGFTFDYYNNNVPPLLYSNLYEVLFDFKNKFEIGDIEIPYLQAKLDLYILYKITSICDKYISYNDFILEGIKYGKITSRKIDVEKFLEKFSDSGSHIVIKLKQIVSFIKNYWQIWSKLLLKTDENFIKVTELSQFLQQVASKDNTPLLEILPPPIFETFLYSGENTDVLNTVSSGEMQMITSITSILYHLNNLNSVEKERGVIVKYNYVNLILDEIELYFHPEFQRRYLKKLLDDISKFNLPEIFYINILIVSHSPFILSDIPKQNVLFLETETSTKNSQPKEYFADNTFSENIHEILANGFFLEETMGAFAKSKIYEFLEFEINKVENKEELYLLKRDDFVALINLVGEDVIREILKNHLSRLDRKFLAQETIINNLQQEIMHLQRQLQDEQNKLSK